MTGAQHSRAQCLPEAQAPLSCLPLHLDDIAEDEGIKAGQVLHVVALDHGRVPLGQATELLHQEQQLGQVAAPDTGVMATGQTPQPAHVPPLRFPVPLASTPQSCEPDRAQDRSPASGAVGLDPLPDLPKGSQARTCCPGVSALPVRVVLRGLGLGDMLSVTHQPAHLITAEGQRHEDVQCLVQGQGRC